MNTDTLRLSMLINNEKVKSTKPKGPVDIREVKAKQLRLMLQKIETEILQSSVVQRHFEEFLQFFPMSVHQFLADFAKQQIGKSD